MLLLLKTQKKNVRITMILAGNYVIKFRGIMAFD